MSSTALVCLIGGAGVLAVVMSLILRWDAKAPSDAPAITDVTLRQVWQERAEASSADYGLAGVRAVAGKWATTAGALLGLLSTVAIVAGPSDLAKDVGGTEGLVAAGMVLGAGALAAVATLLAGLAEQGTPVSASVNDPAGYRHLVKTRANRAAKELKLSRILTLLAVVLVVGAAGVAWLAALTGEKKASAQSALVVSGEGVRCGTLTGSDGDVQLKAGSAPAAAIPAGADVQLVDSCP